MRRRSRLLEGLEEVGDADKKTVSCGQIQQA